MSDEKVRTLQEEAYVSVLRAFHETKCRNWGHQQLLKNLREKLAISRDKHIECLKCVLSNSEGQTRATKEEGSSHVLDEEDRLAGEQGDETLEQDAPERSPGRTLALTVAPPTAKVSKYCRCDPPSVEPKSDRGRSGRLELAPPTRGKTAHGEREKSEKSGESRYLKLTSDMLHGFDESGLPRLYGQALETFWEENPEEGEWYSAVVTDYAAERREHQLTYDPGTAQETFEWVSLDEELRKGNIRAPDLPPVPSSAGRVAKEGRLPFEDGFFERMLRDGTRAELQCMLAQTQRKIHEICADLEVPKSPTTQEDAVAAKIVRRSHLIEGLKRKRTVQL